jgi:hypothetical protein
MTSLARQLLVFTVSITAIPLCYGQMGVAAGAGVEQWNRQRELDIQQQQIEIQKRMQEMELKRWETEDRQRESSRRNADDYQQQRKMTEEKNCNEQRAVLAAYETEFGEAGIATAKRVRAKIAEQGWKNSCVPPLTGKQFIDTIAKAHQQTLNDIAIDARISRFMSNKKEYSSANEQQINLDI